MNCVDAETGSGASVAPKNSEKNWKHYKHNVADDVGSNSLQAKIGELTQLLRERRFDD